MYIKTGNSCCLLLLSVSQTERWRKGDFYEKYVNCFYDNSIKRAIISIEQQTKVNQGRIATIEFELDDIHLVKQSDGSFAALLELRKELELKDIKLLCKGCAKNVYPSRMSFDMGGGTIAYVMELGKQATERVNIFDECDLEEYSTISEQLDFVSQWYESLRQ